MLLTHYTCIDNKSQTMYLLYVVSLHLHSPFLLFCRVIFIYLAVGLWVYPLLGLLNTSGVLGLFLLNMTVVTIMYLLGRTLNNCVWGE